MALSLSLLMIFLNVITTNCHNIVACGGFIKADINNFPYNKLSANLIFPDGTINYVTDVLPNGAYSVPIYDIGQYIIKVVGPKGWNIEPSTGFHLDIDGQDSCPEDYNFKFSGYSIYGKVTTANINQGPSGIRVDLLKLNKVINFGTTVEGGEFVINNVLPGKYQLNIKSKTIDGKSVELTDDKYSIEVINDNVLISNSFIINGYPVFGDIHFKSQPVIGVEFLIFSKSFNAYNFDFAKYKCFQVDRNELKVEGYYPLCKAISNDKGEFIFPLLPGGEYFLLPIYEHKDSKFSIEPVHHKFQVTSHSIDLRSIFTISGFSVKGRVAVLDDSVGINNAEIYMDGGFVTKSDSNGNFIIICVNEGFHKLSVIANGYLFNETMMKFDSTYPIIKTLHPFKVSICGEIVVDRNYNSKNIVNDLTLTKKIVLIDEITGSVVDTIYADSKLSDKSQEEKMNDITSTFCIYAVPGVYVIKPMTDSFGSLSLAPNQIKVHLKMKPVIVRFSQFRGTISGHVNCIERCHTGEFEVTLRSADDKEYSHLIQHIFISESLPTEGYFTFQDIVPGDYYIELISANGHLPSYKTRWCWSTTIIPIKIVDENITSGLVFKQIGFSVQIHLSHNMQLTYFHLKNGQRSSFGSKNLTKGLGEICIPEPGKYELKADTCHKLANDSIFIDTYVDFPFSNNLKLDVIQYKVNVDFILDSETKVTDKKELEFDIKGLITYDLNLNPIEKSIEWKDNVGRLQFWVEPEKSVQVSTESNKYLVTPSKLNFQISRDTLECITNVGNFKLEPGTFIVGSIVPPIGDVVVEVSKKTLSPEEDILESIIAHGKSDETGKFRLGPLPSFKYAIKLSKSGYKFIKTESTEDAHIYQSLKLAELHVQIVDLLMRPIPGILLSIIGDNIRKNELTDENGKFEFVGLSGGTYYLRAMMKELEFQPEGAIEIKMAEGTIENVVINASRTSFSVYGKVVSLNGDPESGLFVTAEPSQDIDAISDFACKVNLMRNEHAISDESGSFRIRGLLPKCSYKLTLKISGNEDKGIVRSHPRHMNLKMSNEDAHDIKLYALRSMNVREISAMVLTNNDAYLNSLQLSIFPSGNPDNVISIHKFMSDSLYFQMNLPNVHKKMEYVIRLQSNLNPRLFSNISAQEINFVIIPGVKNFIKYFQFTFYPSKNTVVDLDVSLTVSSSIMIPLFLGFMFFIFHKQKSLKPLLILNYVAFKKYVTRFFSNRGYYLSGNTITATTLDAADISELNSVIAKPKPIIIATSIKKPPFWLRPKKA